MHYLFIFPSDFLHSLKTRRERGFYTVYIYTYIYIYIYSQYIAFHSVYIYIYIYIYTVYIIHIVLELFCFIYIYIYKLKTCLKHSFFNILLSNIYLKAPLNLKKHY